MTASEIISFNYFTIHEEEKMSSNNLTFPWRRLSLTGPGPKARSCHALCSAGGSKLVLFGGYNADDETQLADTWELDASSRAWTKIAAKGEAPCAREYHAMAYAGGSKAVLFGGTDESGDDLNDTWEYDSSARAWTRGAVAGSAPPARSNLALAWAGGSKVVLFGGLTHRKDKFINLGDVWEYDALTHEWTRCDAGAKGPAARYDHALAHAGSKLVLFGGKTSYSKCLGDTWEYDIQSRTWIEYKPEAAPQACGGALAFKAGSTVVFCNGLETWEYDASTHLWTLAKKAKSPSLREYFAMSDGGGSSLFLFGGGQGADLDTSLKDTWELDLGTGASKLAPAGAPSEAERPPAKEKTPAGERTPAPKRTSAIGLKGAQERIASAQERGKLDKPAAPWLREEKLAKLKWKKGGELDADAVRFLFYRQKTLNDVAIEPEAKDVYALIDPASGAGFALSLLDLVLKHDRLSSKVRFALSVAGALGDDALIPTIERIAVGDKNRNAVQTIGLIGSPGAARSLQRIMRAFAVKYPNVKEAAREAFNRIADGMSLTPYELFDRIVPDFGFKDRERPLVVGKARYAIVVTPDFKLALKQDGRTVKSPPAGAPDKVKEELKNLGREIRTAGAEMRETMVQYMVVRRRWSAGDWKDFFLSNVCAFAFARGLVWAVYEKNVLKKTFIAGEDGKLLDAALKAAAVGAKAEIRLPHPLELTAAVRDGWRACLERAGLTQPFPQIDRPVFAVDAKRKARTMSNEFANKKLGAGTFTSRAGRLGWRRGSVVDSGEVSAYRKEFRDDGLDVFLSLDGLCVGDHEGEVRLKEWFCVKRGSVVTGGYTYDEPADEKDERLVALGAVPPVIYSEIVLDLKEITKGKAGAGGE
jgi:N-acetylneuraminic acid mutarotase